MTGGDRALVAVAAAVPAYFALLWVAEWLHAGVWGPAAVAAIVGGALAACVRRWHEGASWGRAAAQGAVAAVVIGALWTWLWVFPALRIAANG